MVTLFYSPAYVASGHAFDTTRKAQWVADALKARNLEGIILREPASLTGTEVAEVHDPAYVRAIETGEPRELAESQGFAWDPGIYPMVLASNGGAVAAALTALKTGTAGSLSSGLHHARQRRGAGFCTFNGLALAARAASKAGAKTVLILDLDAHCGGGTRSLVRESLDVWQCDISVDTFDRYPPSPRATLEFVTHADEYLPTIQRALERLRHDAPPFDLCMYNAGMDPCENCDLGGLAGITREILKQREQMVFEWAAAQRLPIAFVLAGGYIGERLDEAALAELHLLTVEAAARAATDTRKNSSLS